MGGKFKRYCDACVIRKECEYTFAKYWPSKSSGGIGCDCPTGDEVWAAAVNAARRIADCAPVVKPREVSAWAKQRGMTKADALARLRRMTK